MNELLTRIVALTVPPVIEHGIGKPTMKSGSLLLIVQLVSRRLKPLPKTDTEEPLGPRSGDTVTTRGTMLSVVDAEEGVPGPVTVIV